MRPEKIAVIGLGYVGLPLSVALSKKFQVIGFDINARRVEALRSGVDWTNEVPAHELRELRFSDRQEDLMGHDIYIVTVPTPIDEAKRPDFRAILTACEIVGRVIGVGAVIVFESTVYPGVTEEICAPALEKASGLRSGTDFKLGYSPERINPGDKERPLEKIVKVVAGQDAQTLERIASIYGAVIDAGIHRASSIKVAEAAKVIENTQRDVNIAMINEVSKICELIGISSSEVLAAARTKWNFLKFEPGLVGGHCIGVDPYYLTAKAEQLGYYPQVILAGRRINDGMGGYVAQKVLKLLAKRALPVRGCRVGILGFTFKENVPDIRNSKVADVYDELCAFGVKSLVHDPLADETAVENATGIKLSTIDKFTQLHALVLAVPHKVYRELSPVQISDMLVRGGIFADIKSTFEPQSIRRDLLYWSL